MKHLRLIALFTTALLCTYTVRAQQFFPVSATFRADIPSPEAFLGYPLGSHHTRHDQIVAYFKELARLSDRAQLQEIGRTHEHRMQVVLTLSAPENLNRLEEIRQKHLAIGDKGVAAEVGQPLILLLGYGVHGNEPSSAEAAMLTAYYLAASTDAEVLGFLKGAVIMIDPVYNPDGRDRHSHWVNMHKATPPVADPADREHNEVWPGGRTNHYWFDLNRDWLPLVQPESRARVDFYHRWRPHVATDFHEMGTNSTYFFEPTKPIGSESPLVPRENYEVLNVRFARYFASAFDSAGALYFTKEAFDNSYPGYGSTYPDFQGGLGLLFEQASSRGHVQEGANGLLSFGFTIQNQWRASLATLRAALNERELLHDYMFRFFRSALEAGAKSPVKAYVFGHSDDANRNRAFIDLLLRHRIKIYESTQDIAQEGRVFSKGKAWLVPLQQEQYRMVQSMFERVTRFDDSVFYDASTWTSVLAYGMPHAALRSLPPLGQQLSQAPAFVQAELPAGAYAYLLDYTDHYAPRALSYLLQKGVRVQVSFRPFTVLSNGTRRNFGRGTLSIPLGIQMMDAAQLRQVLQEASKSCEVNFVAVQSGLSLQGVDLGSNQVRTVGLPSVLMPVGAGVNAYEAGEIWFKADQHLMLPITKAELSSFARINLNRYHVLILPGGSYAGWEPAVVEKIKRWVNEGGTLIVMKNAVEWALKNGFTSEQLALPKVLEEAARRIDFEKAADTEGAKAIGGSIYEAELDISNPIGFGYSERKIWVYRNGKTFLQPSANPYATVLAYTEKPHLSGYIAPDNLKRISGAPSVVVGAQGSGRVIMFTDNPVFRGTWLGTEKLLYNAVFFGPLLSVPAPER